MREEIQDTKEIKMDPITLAQEIIDGRRITRDDDLSFFLTCDLDELCKGADMIREKFIGDKVDLCSIINGRSGKCPEDCKYCAQSAHNHTNCEVYDFLPEEKILEACRMNEREGVDRFSIVTAGKALTGEEFEKAIHAYETMKKECSIDLCASMGFLTREQLHRLHEAGVSSYHHNIETSKRYFPQICTTHTYEQKIATLKMVKEEGMYVCSGGVAGFSVKKVRLESDPKKSPVMGVMGAFVFAAQMINFTIPGTGSSGHLCGGMMLTALLGPYAAFRRPRQPDCFFCQGTLCLFCAHSYVTYYLFLDISCSGVQ